MRSMKSARIGKRQFSPRKVLIAAKIRAIKVASMPPMKAHQMAKKPTGKKPPSEDMPRVISGNERTQQMPSRKPPAYRARSNAMACAD